MAYILVDDKSPESDEYSNNYIYVDENKVGAMKQMMQVCRQKAAEARKPAYEFLCDNCSAPCFC